MKQSTAQLVANRVRCLYACFLRAHAEASKKRKSPGLALAQTMPADEQFALCQRALSDDALAHAWTRAERAYVSRKLGSFKVWEMRAGIYCADAIYILAASLHATDDVMPATTPAYLVTKPKFGPEAMLGGEPAPWLEAPKLAAVVERRRIAKLCAAYAWRCRLQSLALTSVFDAYGTDGEIDRFVAALVRKRAAACKRLGLFQPIKGDFPFAGKTYAAYFTEDCFSTMPDQLVMSQRLRAALWLQKPETSWESVRAPTPRGFTIPLRLRGTASKLFIDRIFDPHVDFESFKNM